MSSDKKYMLQALCMAEEGRGSVEPNPMVGAVIARGGGILGKGVHRRFGGPHAEADAIKNAVEAGNDITGAELYVTLEPCAHHGKTPPCTEAIIGAGLKKVVIAAEDPLWKRHSAKSPRRGIDVLRGAGIEVEVGICRNAAVMQNAAFYKKAELDMPLTVAKWAMSADGKIAAKDGSSKWISGPQSRRSVHELRGMVDAVVVGAGTACIDNPLLTCRGGEIRRTAERIVLCEDTAPPPDSRLVRTAKQIPLFLAYCKEEPPEGLARLESLGCRCMPLPPSECGQSRQASLSAMLQTLSSRGASNVLVEGGSTTLGRFFDEDLVDRVLVFITPSVIGGEKAVTAVGGGGVDEIGSALRFKGPVVLGDSAECPDGPAVTVKLSGSDILIEGWVHDPLDWYVAP